MKILAMISLCLAFSMSVEAQYRFKKKHYVPNPGDVMVSLHGNIYTYNVNSDIRTTDSDLLIFGYLKGAYHLFNGLYVGGVYHHLNDDANEKHTFGFNLTYAYKILQLGATYMFHSNHKYRTDTVNAELEKGSGYLLDASLNFPVSWNFYVGLGFTYHHLSYDEVDFEDTNVTNSNISDEEDFFMPMIQFTYFFGTHGKRIHDKSNQKKSQSNKRERRY